jgi:uncharacterized cupin superfamily protein
MTDRKIIRLNAAPKGFGEVADDLTQDMFDSKLPVQHSHEYFADDEIGLYVSVWDTTDMTEVAGPYPCDEFMWLLEGEAVIKNCKSGAMEKAIAGEPFVIPRGYHCQWHQSGYLRKFFLISENPNEPVPDRPAVEGIIIPQEDSPMGPPLTAEPFRADSSSTIQRQHISYRDHSGNFLAGSWESDPFESAGIPFPCHQLAYVTEGSLTLIDENGNPHVFGPGDALFVPEGVLCSARATEKVRLFFARVKTSKQEGS